MRLQLVQHVYLQNAQADIQAGVARLLRQLP